MMKSARLSVAPGLCSLLAGLTLCTAQAQTSHALLDDVNNTDSVLIYGMGYSAQRFSPLTRINKDNVNRLVPKWSLSMNDSNAAEGQPIIYDGLIYVTTHNATVAIDALTGKQLWRTIHEYPPEALRAICCGIVNRGVAIFEGKVIRALIDNQIVALDAKTGKEVWKTASPGIKSASGYAMTGAPLIANGVVVVGVAGGDNHSRGFIEGYDARSGRHLWRHWNIPAPGEPGSETWQGASANNAAGGSSWVTGSYDPELDLVYWGTGNPSPWNARGRPGDNLYTDSIVALRPGTGERVWYYQTTPNDPFDYDGVNQPVLATLQVNGQPRKVLMQANRNGFLYVLDRTNGKFIAANAMGKMNWADGVDPKTGRPRVTQVFQDAISGKPTIVWPDSLGGANWMHMAFSPRTEMVYLNTIHMGLEYFAPEPETYKAGQPAGPVSVRRKLIYEDPVRGFLKAIDPLTGQVKWQVPYKSPNFGSTMVTASGLVFTGVMTGEFEAHDADTGKLLWSFQTPSGVLGQPITWERNGKQYVTVMSGIGGVYALRFGDPNLANVPAGASVWTFGLFDK